MAKFVSRQQPVKAGAPPAPVVGDGLVDQRFPALWEYLTLTAWDDGKPRQTATLLLFTEDGCWKGCLNDRDGSRALWLASSDPISLLDVMERQLTDGTAVWRRVQPRPVPGGRK